MALTLARGILTATFRQLRDCGQGRDECVVYWTGPRDTSGAVDDAVIPVHRAGPDWYETDPAWVTSFFLELRCDRRMVRAQVHTHPGIASHSDTDDRYPLAPNPGFHSLVIPRFGIGPVRLNDAYLVVLEDDGTWAERDPIAEIKETA
jgi:hypothetical protein